MDLLTDKTYQTVTYTDKEELKEIAVKFFYWWHNQPGSNTAEGFEEWLKLQARCVECGARSPKEAETKCICGGDKDSCHGEILWADWQP